MSSLDDVIQMGEKNLDTYINEYETAIKLPQEEQKEIYFPEINQAKKCLIDIAKSDLDKKEQAFEEIKNENDLHNQLYLAEIEEEKRQILEELDNDQIGVNVSS